MFSDSFEAAATQTTLTTMVRDPHTVHASLDGSCRIRDALNALEHDGAVAPVLAQEGELGPRARVARVELTNGRDRGGGNVIFRRSFAKRRLSTRKGT